MITFTVYAMPRRYWKRRGFVFWALWPYGIAVRLLWLGIELHTNPILSYEEKQ